METRYDHRLYQGYDIRLRGCRALLKITGDTVEAQFDEVHEDPVFNPNGAKTKPDNIKFKHLTGPPPEPISYCLGWHRFSREDFSITTKEEE